MEILDVELKRAMQDMPEELLDELPNEIRRVIFDRRGKEQENFFAHDIVTSDALSIAVNNLRRKKRNG